MRGGMRARDETEEWKGGKVEEWTAGRVGKWKGVRGVDSRRLEAREVDAKGQTCRVTLFQPIFGS